MQADADASAEKHKQKGTKAVGSQFSSGHGRRLAVSLQAMTRQRLRQRQVVFGTVGRAGHVGCSAVRVRLFLAHIGLTHAYRVQTAMHLDLTDEELLALLDLLTRAIAADPYPFFPRLQVLRDILAKIGVDGFPHRLLNTRWCGRSETPAGRPRPRSGIREPLGGHEPAQQFRALPKVRLYNWTRSRGKLGFNFGQHLWQGDRTWNERLVQIARGHLFCLASACINILTRGASRWGKPDDAT